MAQLEGSLKEKTRMNMADRIFWAVLIFILVSILLLISAAVLLPFGFTRNSISVVNESGQKLYNVTLSYKLPEPERTDTVVERKVLLPGEEITHSHRYNDLGVLLIFTLNGEKFAHDQGVDLWTGETYVFRIQPGGTVTSKHEYD